jgi:hypothetical protein
MTDQKIIDAFRLMWDSFPEPVMLVEKTGRYWRSIGLRKKTGGRLALSVLRCRRWNGIRVARRTPLFLRKNGNMLNGKAILVM